MNRKPSSQGLLKVTHEAKARRRKALAKQPYLKKIEVVLKLQRIENEVRRATGRPVRPEWPE